MGSGVSVSQSTITPGNFELSPCRVTYKGVDLGATVGNVKVTIKEELAELKSDQLGKTIIDRRVSGFTCTIETSLAETQNLNNWAQIFPAHKLVTQGGFSNFYFDSAVGTSLADLAGALVLHPLSRPNSDTSGDVTVYLAAANGASEYEFGPDKQIVMKIHWDMYPDFTTQPPRFLLFGNPTAGAVGASAGAATGATGNIGTGTVTGISVYNPSTVTQNVTLKCVTAGTGGQFYVSGSQDGALGLATVGVGFVGAANGLDQIGFTINTGGTAFAVGDSFTIATTAANYI
jgi:hypothetical protein